jgi:ferredoxin
MPADGVLSADTLVAPTPGTHRCWIRPAGTGDEVTGTWFDVRHGERLLHEMIKRQVADIPVGCRGGGCGVCRIRVIDGDYTTKRMSRAHVSEADEADGVALACRVIPATDLVVELAPATTSTDLPTT